MSKKTVLCSTCFGHGKILKMHNGTVIDSWKCKECNGTGKIPKPRKQ